MLRTSPLFSRVIARQLPLFTLLATLGFSLLTFGYLVYFELGPFSAVELQIDELYFYSCAARQAVTGLLFNPGCHDNKPPLIYLIHHLVQPHPYLYSVWAGKLAAFGVMALMLGAVAALAQRLAGWAAAVCAVALLIAALASKAQFWALKTESVGLLLVLGAFWLMTARRTLHNWRWGGAGLLLGLAVLVKQTNLIFLGVSCVWLLWTGRAHWGATMRSAGCLVLAGCFPFLLYFAGVSWEGRAESFLASFFVYPSVYAEGPPQSFYAYVIRFADVYELVTTGHEPLFWLFVLGGLQTVYQWLVAKDHDARLASRWLVLWACLCTLAVAMISPTFFEYHAIPVWVFLSILAGVAFGDLWRGLVSVRRPEAVMLGLILSGCSLAGLMQAWYHNAGHGSLPASAFERIRIDGASGQYGYVLGMPWPSFYTDNGLIPASDLLFPWALPGMPKFGLYTPPPPESAKGQRLAAIQAKNLVQLWKDFAQTPPRYIGVVDGIANAPGSTRAADVPGFDEYLQAHCSYFKTVTRERLEYPNRPLVVYRCDER